MFLHLSFSIPVNYKLKFKLTNLSAVVLHINEYVNTLAGNSAFQPRQIYYICAMTHILGIIPARYASTRFPVKALVDIQGKTMVQRVYEQAIQAASLQQVVVATDHPAIFDN